MNQAGTLHRGKIEIPLSRISCKVSATLTVTWSLDECLSHWTRTPIFNSDQELFTAIFFYSPHFLISNHIYASFPHLLTPCFFTNFIYLSDLSLTLSFPIWHFLPQARWGHLWYIIICFHYTLHFGTFNTIVIFTSWYPQGVAHFLTQWALHTIDNEGALEEKL